MRDLSSCFAMILATVAGTVGCAAPAAGQGLELALELVVDGLSRPLSAVAPGDGTDRLFIVEQTGLIRIWDGASLKPTPFLDLGPSINCCGERGLLGLAFHPNYVVNGLFFVSYTDNFDDTVIARFEVSGDPNVADPSSEVVVLTQFQPASNHNNGHLAFGPDGYLYVGMGDGGPGNDPDNRGQDLTSLLAKILRLDIDNPDPPLNYGIPEDNPFVEDALALDEIWAFGLRNPWRFSFDRETGDLWVGDVGQRDFEEVNLQPSSSPGGENYGWRLMEGTSCFIPETDCDDGSLTLPVLEYPHTEGCAVTGGFRYRGTDHPALSGVYLYGDFCEGLIWGTVPRCDGVIESRTLLDSSLSLASFGENSLGELYAVDLLDIEGAVYKVGLASETGGPAMAAIPAGLDFPPVEVGASEVLELELVNDNLGPEALVFESFAVSAPGVFTVDPVAGSMPCGSLPRCLAPGESCTVEVTFDGASQGARVEELVLSGGFEPLSVRLLAAAYEPCGEPGLLVVENQEVSEPTDFLACAEIQVGPDVVVASGGSATFRAGFEVIFGNGVSVENDAELRVELMLLAGGL